MLVKRKVEETLFVSSKEAKFENKVVDLPTEIWLSIFSFFQPNTLVCCAMVCHEWHILANDDLIWKSLFLQNYSQSYFSAVDAFIKEKHLLWKQVYQVLPDIVCFNDTIWNTIIGSARQQKASETARRAGNPHWFNVVAPPFVINGKFEFFVGKSSNTIVAKDSYNQIGTCLTFEGDSNDVFSALSVEKDLLFAHTHTGNVVSWDIHTKKMQRFEPKETQLNTCPDFFLVQDGWIVRINHSQQLVVVSIENPEKVQVCKDGLFNNSLPKRVIAMKYIVDNMLYLIDQHSTISIWDLKEGKKIDCIEADMPLQHLMCVKEDKIYFADSNKIYLVDRKDRSSKELMRLEAESKNKPLAMRFFGDNFLLVFYANSSKSRASYSFSVIDIRTCKFITKNKAIESDSMQNIISNLVHSCLDCIFS